VLGDALAEEAPHPFFVVGGAELPPRLALDRPHQPDQAVLHHRHRQAEEVGLEREPGVEVGAVVVDVGFALLGVEVVPQELADQGLHLGIDGEQDVRPEVEEVAVDRHRPRQAADPFLFFVELPVGLARLLEGVGGRHP
jgi:hypothetical protein